MSYLMDIDKFESQTKKVLCKNIAQKDKFHLVEGPGTGQYPLPILKSNDFD